MKIFTPKKYIKNFTCVDFEQLQQAGITMIICDVDNTLVAHDEKLPTDAVHTFVKKVHEFGFQFCLISNNFSERVQRFAKALDVHAYDNAKKPLRHTYKKIIRDYKVNPKQVACIGDQILTDVVGGNRMQMYTILTHPLYTKDLSFTKINRLFERMVFNRLEKKGVLSKGGFDE